MLPANTIHAYQLKNECLVKSYQNRNSQRLSQEKKEIVHN